MYVYNVMQLGGEGHKMLRFFVSSYLFLGLVHLILELIMEIRVRCRYMLSEPSASL